MRILAIGDIHGCSTAFKTLLDAVKPGPEDLLVTMGDYVDRGPDTRGVIDTLLGLEKTTQLRPLTGNHEILFLDALNGSLDVSGWLHVGGRETLASYGHEGQGGYLKSVPAEHVEFLSNRCLRYVETENHIFVHANANSVYAMNEQSDDWLFWTRFDHSFPHVSGKTMICGHTAQKNGRPALHPKAICIDTWAYGGGWLTCLDVTAGMFYQTNQEGEMRQFSLAQLEAEGGGPTTQLIRG
ncbi:MAG TPA: metallophosphoesterase family protein [Prosthecobacter sp.]